MKTAMFFENRQAKLSSRSRQWSAWEDGLDGYPFGMQMSGRNFNGVNGYRFGFTGHEKEDEIYEEIYSTEYRLYDARIGRWLSTDPLASLYPSFSPYMYALANPIRYVDPDGRLVADDDGLVIGVQTGERTDILISSTPKGNYIYEETAFIYDIIELYPENGGDKPIQALKYNSTAVTTYDYANQENGKPKILDRKEIGIPPDYDPIANCHGFTFANNELLIQDAEISSLLANDNYETNPKGNVAIYYGNDAGDILHSAQIRNELFYTNGGIKQVDTKKPRNEKSAKLGLQVGDAQRYQKQGADKRVSGTNNLGDKVGKFRIISKTDEVQRFKSLLNGE